MSIDEKVTEAITKVEIAATLNLSVRTLAFYCNDKYFSELEKLGYQKNQKKFTPAQVNYLKEKLGF